MKRVQPIETLCCVPIRCGLWLAALMLATCGLLSMVEAYLALVLPESDMPTFVQDDESALIAWRFAIIFSDLLLFAAAIGAINWMCYNFLTVKNSLTRSFMLVFLVMFMRVCLSVTEVIMSAKATSVQRWQRMVFMDREVRQIVQFTCPVLMFALILYHVYDTASQYEL